MKEFKVGDRVKCIKPFDGWNKCVWLYGTIICLDNTYDCCVEFDNNIGGHDGGRRGKYGHCRRGYFEELELANDVKTITIEVRSDTATATMDGRTVTVNYTANKDLATEVGAKLALDRLFEKPKLKIEVGKYYKLKPYDEVTDHASITKYNWDKFQKYPVKCIGIECNDKPKAACYFDDGRTINLIFDISAFECETEPLYNGKVVCIDNRANGGNYTVGKIYQFVNGLLKADCGETLPAKRVSSFEEWAKFSSAKFIEIKEDTTK